MSFTLIFSASFCQGYPIKDFHITNISNDNKLCKLVENKRVLTPTDRYSKDIEMSG